MAATTIQAAKVLVADDSEAERATARAALSEAGYEVVEALDGQHALEVFARERPDLVLLDVVMPRLTGLETCRILKAKTQSSYLPVIMVSTRNSVNARVEGLRTGADDYLGKPYDAEELRARVEALLRTRRVLAEAEAPEATRVRTPSSPASPASSPTSSSQGTARESAPGRSDQPRDDAAVRRRLEEEFDRADRYSDPLTCLRIELDGHAKLTRAHGAEPAARLRRELHDIIDGSIRKIDLVFGVDERGFMFVLPNTHFPGALAVAERIARDARRLALPGGEGKRASVSVGISFFPNKDTHSLQDLLDLVDAALERARGEGGGHICLYQHQGYLYRPED